MKKNNWIYDEYGQKIGGSRRDLYEKEITAELLANFTDEEKRAYVKRETVWPLEDPEKMIEDGYEKFAVYMQRAIRRRTYAKPNIYSTDHIIDDIMKYNDAMRALHTRVLEIRTRNDLWVFFRELSTDMNASIEKYGSAVMIRDIRKLGSRLSSMEQQMKKSGFPEKSSSSSRERKKAFLPPQLINIEREGDNYRLGREVIPEDFMETFNFRAFEFGTWMTQKDRHASLDFAYDALKDLAIVLDVDDKDIGFNGNLALAFGARGSNRGSAHYEPLRQVINLTKMRGAGCTAHEWFHAFDDVIRKWCDIPEDKLASEITDPAEVTKLPKAFTEIVNALRTDENGQITEYLRGSRHFDRKYAKEAHGGWASNAEMMARAFACYVKDCYNKRSDYLMAHADVYTFEYENQSICAIPQGEEREMLDEMFDRLFFELKEIGFFHQRQVVTLKKPKKSKPIPFPLVESDNGQLRFAV